MTRTLFEQRDSSSPEYDHMYNRIMQVPGARQRFDDMWQIFQPYADPNFEDEFLLHPRERFWEMMLTVALLDGGIDISCPKPGPDIRISSDDRTVWVEAVAPSSGLGPNSVPIPPDDKMFDYPEPQIILRFRNALDNKYKGYKK
jgi:type I restriction enzyme S subunit